MKIDNNTLNEIRNNLDIVDIVSSYLPLTSKGKNYFGVCPFHDDHSPSMSVSKEKQIYTCFSCGATGNVFKFIQDYENISFLEAVKKCADIAHVYIDIEQAKEKNKHQELYDIYELSQKFYQNNINTQLGKKAKEYLKNRKLDETIIKEFGIGLSLNEMDSLTKLLKSKKYDDKILIRSGLVNENNYTLNDVYRNRIMFPLYDLNGKVIGYNGRVYNGETENKYVNSKETDIFKKRELLYNYHRAKEEARKKHQIIIMEGPMDIIRAHTIGIKNCVAALGTAFGKEQAMLVRKLSSNVILCFDGDDAGLKATKGAIVELQKLGITPKIVRLENNSDPDDYIIKNGKDAFLNKINNPMNIMEFKESLLKSEYNLNNTEELANYINTMIKEIDNIDDDILKSVSINKLSKETGVDIELIKSKLTKKETVNIQVKPKKEIKKLNKYIKSEQYLIYYMLQSVDVIKMYQKKITHMPTEAYRHLAFQIDLFYKEHGFINTADLITYLNDDIDSIKALGEITSLNLPNEVNYDEIDDYLNNIKEYNEKSQANIYKDKLRSEVDYKKKLELANKALEIKKRREENDR
ncbi:MAG: DNA primase [Firmicutes bacterium]|nr:DNA primase [Bacillota bacterium]